MRLEMMMVRRRLACCTREREVSLDFDEQERIMTYDGLESCINQSNECESGTSRGDGCMSDSLDDDNSSCSSSKDVYGSFSSKWIGMKRADGQSADEWELTESPQRFYVKEKLAFATRFSDVETLKETFSKLLLGEDITGGSNGLASALALSNAITHLAASVFGELWKLEPLSEERKARWKKEMDWLLSPTNYMVELVPAKQNGVNGRMLEIMTPKARADIHMNLPALQKLDSMLIGILDSMVNTEFWYSEVGSRAEGRSKSAKESKRWWLPLPQVPTAGLSDMEKKKLLCKSKMVYQVYKAAKSINESVLLEMPVPTIIKDALPKSGRANLGEALYKVLTTSTSTAEGMLTSLQLDSENNALEIVNKLEAAIFAWKEKIDSQASGKSPTRTSWSFVKDPMSEHDKTESMLTRAEVLLQLVKSRYPNLPQTFLDATKIQYGKDVGTSILEAYSRVLGNLAFSILRRVGDILQEDALSNPDSPVAKHDIFMLSGSPIHSQHIRLSLIDQMNKADLDTATSASSDVEFSSSEARASSAYASTPGRSRVWCAGGEACLGVSPGNSP